MNKGKAIVFGLIVVIIAVFVITENARKAEVSAPIVPPEIPTASSTQTERASYVRYIGSTAATGDTIDVTDCGAPVPAVLGVTIGDSVKFVNLSGANRLVNIYTLATFSLPPQGEKIVSTAAFKGPGAHTYSCDGVQKAGIIYAE